ncbi:NAD(P)/FAD-dependent oxidoreductase [Ktedonosporobacter rubrisoli]|uniref:NADH:ubiquinone reductase (non-electrogenic) n=1 Tax=Ktedonosporobacter rubrisoli TaxID=2509675 RepID=A0A4P6K235_KTERU|nr:NAD(P)/FAD-dependent oxidoreductase [Ktedonosporobacter rubrisoli]QBD82184.1 NAD(P)/FAD-dependent oxidoreductase [Ktedonosporobacter rubrisoli]
MNTQDAIQTEKERQDGTGKSIPRVVIIGAGFGGIRAARALHNAPVQVTVIDRNNHHLFQPLLYQVATAGLSPADISAPIRGILKKQKNTEVVMAEVTGVDLEQRQVLTQKRELPYDYLVVATGASHSYFGHNEWAPYAPGLKSIVDATALRRKILLAFEAAEMAQDEEQRRNLLTFVLVGGGPTGVEMAGAIAELAHKALVSDFRHIDPASARILLVEALPRILPAFPEKLSKKAQQALEHLGVEVCTNSPVEQIDEDGVVIGGQRLVTRNVIWTAGVAASPAGKWLNAEVDRAGRVKVDADLSLPGHPEVFVVGDTASCMQDDKPLPGVAPVAMQEGTYVAEVIAQRVAGKEQPRAFRYKNKGNLATIGRSYGIADVGKLRFGGFIGWIFWWAVHIFFLIGFRNRFLVMFQWAWAYFTYQRGARLITFDPAALQKQKELVEELTSV